MQSNNFYKPFSWVMIFVVLILSGTLFFLVTRKEGVIKPFTDKQLAEIPVFDPPVGGGFVEPSLAHEMIKQYHLKGRTLIVVSPKKLGLWHDETSLKNYINETFPNYCKAHDVSNTNFKDYKWKIGFYYSLSRKTTTSDYKLNVCLIPTLVNDAGDVIDFYVAYGNPVYDGVYPPINKNQKDLQQTTNDYIYDTGEIWP